MAHPQHKPIFSNRQHNARFPHPRAYPIHLMDMPSLNFASPTSTESAPGAANGSVLDNPILNSLLTGHAALAIAHGQARRFPAEIGPLAGIPDQSAASYDDLRALAGPAGTVALFFEAPPAPPPGWTLLRGGLLDQMVCAEPAQRRAHLLPHEADMRRLNAGDALAMVELAALTEPGPFFMRTIELGTFFGIFHGCRLVAMAGQRLSLPGFIEVSAVCTHPDARGRGYAPTLMTTVMEDIRERGKTPMLHSYSSNAAAIAVYRSLGFTLRRAFHLAVLRHDL
jgi:ribosomal protein S18 acetylase RimI-like enzyme